MDDGGSRAGVAGVGFAIALALAVVVVCPKARTTSVDGTAELTEEEKQLFPDSLQEFAAPRSIFDYAVPPCEPAFASAYWNDWAWKRWVEEQLAAGKDPFPPPEPASNCVGFCFDATIDSVDEDNWRLARVRMIGKKGKKTPALVERTRILSSSRGPATEGKPVRFACFDRFRGEDGLRFEGCSQMATLEQAEPAVRIK